MARRPRHPVRTGEAERQAAASHRLRVRLLVVAAVAVVVAAGLYLFAFSPVLALRTSGIAVVGAGNLVDEGAVRGVVATQVGTPLSKIDTQALGEQIVTIRGVRSVTLTRVWPNGLQVDIVARKPLAQLQQGDHYSLVDADGVEAGESQAQVPDLPVLSIASDSADQRTVKAVLAVLADIPDDLRAQIASIGAASPASVSFTLTDGASVIWGEPGDTDLKVRALGILRSQVQAHEYDLSAPLTPITR